MTWIVGAQITGSRGNPTKNSKTPPKTQKSLDLAHYFLGGQKYVKKVETNKHIFLKFGGFMSDGHKFGSLQTEP